MCCRNIHLINIFISQKQITYACTDCDVEARRLRDGEYTEAVRVHSVPALLCVVVSVIISNRSQGRKLFKMSQNITAVAKPLISI